MDFGNFLELLETRPPNLFTINWIADYTSPNAIYGLLLEPGALSNYGDWRDDEFVALLEAAAAAPIDDVGAAYSAVEERVAAQAPVIPWSTADVVIVADGLRGSATSPSASSTRRGRWTVIARQRRPRRGRLGSWCRPGAAFDASARQPDSSMTSRSSSRWSARIDPIGSRSAEHAGARVVRDSRRAEGDSPRSLGHSIEYVTPTHGDVPMGAPSATTWC